MFCHSCGKKLDDHARSCDACGAAAYVGFAPDDATVCVRPSPSPQQPPYTPPQPNYSMPPAPAKKAPTIGAGRNALAAVPAFFAFLAVILAACAFCLQSVFSVNTVEEYAKEEIIPLLAEREVISFSEAGIPENVMEKLYRIDDIEELLTDTVLDTYENAVFDADHRILTADKLIKVLKNNADEIEEITGYHLTPADYNKIETKFENVGREKLLDIVDELGDKLDDFEDVLELADILFLPITPYMFLLVALGLYIAIFFIRRTSMSSLIWYGAITLSGALVPLSISTVSSLLLKEFRGDSVVRDLLRPFMELVSDHMNGITVGFTAVGLLLLVTGIVLTVLQKRRRS